MLQLSFRRPLTSSLSMLSSYLAVVLLSNPPMQEVSFSFLLQLFIFMVVIPLTTSSHSFSLLSSSSLNSMLFHHSSPPRHPVRICKDQCKNTVPDPKAVSQKLSLQYPILLLTSPYVHNSKVIVV